MLKMNSANNLREFGSKTFPQSSLQRRTHLTNTPFQTPEILCRESS